MAFPQQAARDRGAYAFNAMAPGVHMVIAHLPNNGPAAQRLKTRRDFVAGLVAEAIPSTPRVVVLSDEDHHGTKNAIMGIVAAAHPDAEMRQNAAEYCRFTLTAGGEEHHLLSVPAEVKCARGITGNLIVTSGSSHFSDSDEFQRLLLNGVFPVMRMKDTRWVHVTEPPEGGGDHRDSSRPQPDANFGGIVWRKMPSRDLQNATYVGEWESDEKTVSPEICVSAMEVVGAFPAATLVLLGFTNPQRYQLPMRTLTCTSLPFLVEAGYIGPPRPNTYRAQSALRIFLNPQEPVEEVRATPSPVAPPQAAPGAPRAHRHRRPLPGARALDFDAEVEAAEAQHDGEAREVFIDVAAAEGADAIRHALAQQIMRNALAARLMHQEGQLEDHRERRGRREQREARARPYMQPPPQAMLLEGEDGRVLQVIFGGGAHRRPREPSPPRESDEDKRRRLLAELQRTGEGGEAETSCSVCYGEYATPENNTDESEVVAKLNIAGCTHSVCPDCYQGMLQSGRSVRCPTCRHPIQEIYPDGCIDCLINAGEIAPASVRLSPCEHKCICLGCARQRARDLDTECPVCASDYNSCRAN